MEHLALWNQPPENRLQVSAPDLTARSQKGWGLGSEGERGMLSALSPGSLSKPLCSYCICRSFSWPLLPSRGFLCS